MSTVYIGMVLNIDLKSVLDCLYKAVPHKLRCASETQWNKDISEACNNRRGDEKRITKKIMDEPSQRVRNKDWRRKRLCYVCSELKESITIHRWATSCWPEDWFLMLLWKICNIKLIRVNFPSLKHKKLCLH